MEPLTRNSGFKGTSKAFGYTFIYTILLFYMYYTILRKNIQELLDKKLRFLSKK